MGHITCMRGVGSPVEHIVRCACEKSKQINQKKK